MSNVNPTGKHRPKRRHHGEGTVCRRTDRYRARPWAAVVPYFDQSGRRREMWLSAASREEADDLRKAELRKLAKGLIVTEVTVGEYVRAWLADIDVGPGTLPRYEAHIAQRIHPALGSVPVSALRPDLVRRAMKTWTGAPQTRGGALRLLRAAMKQAVTDRLIEHDPTAGIPYPKVVRHEPVTLTAAEARHLMATVKGERFAPILVVSLGLGVRRGEALGLRMRDVKWENDDAAGVRAPEGLRATGRVSTVDEPTEPGASTQVRVRGVGSVHLGRPVSVTISKSLRYIPPPLRAPDEGPYRLTGTKTGETREIPLPAFVAEALRSSIAEREAELRAAKVHAANDFVFADPVGNSVPLETLYRWFKMALVRAGLPDMRWHDLRATTVTLLLEMGVDLFTIQRIVGHKNLETTRLYVGKTPKAMASASSRMDEAIG